MKLITFLTQTFYESDDEKLGPKHVTASAVKEMFSNETSCILQWLLNNILQNKVESHTSNVRASQVKQYVGTYNCN